MTRGFPRSEYQKRTKSAQRLMAAQGLSALLLTRESDVRYFSGFLTRFWESPSRPWFLIVTTSGDPVAVIPSIGAALMGQTWITDIRTWMAPDLVDDGVSLLIDTLSELTPIGGRIGIPSGHETHVRMPLEDLYRVKAALAERSFEGDHGIVRQLRMVKSDAEIAKITTAVQVADRAFARVPHIASAVVPIDQVFRDFQRLCLEEGADWVPYLAGGAGPSGYVDVISPATSEPLQKGDILMLDTGLVVDGYFCDFDRNWAVGHIPSDAAAAYSKLMEATVAGLAAATVGARASDVFHAMDAIVTGGAGGSEAGRLGHGLGMQLTEWPSLIAGDDSELVDGMVLTLEPGIALPNGRIIVHEENIVVRADGPEMISAAAPWTLPVI